MEFGSDVVLWRMLSLREIEELLLKEAPKNLKNSSLVWLCALLSLPVLSFYIVLMLNARNLPEMDDYDAVLHFLTQFTNTPGVSQKVCYFFASQHVQYKLWFEHAVVLLDYAMTGKVNFFLLQQLGNAFVLLIAGVLWLMFRPPSRTKVERLLLFAPVLFVLFAPRYEETLDWAMAGLQNLTVLFFSFVSVYLCGRKSTTAFIGACLTQVLAMSSSLNGFGIALICAAFFLQRGRKGWALSSAFLALGALPLYAYHYTAAKPDLALASHQAAWKALLLPIAFLGGALGKQAAIVTGIVLVSGVAFLTRKRWYVVEPTTMYAAYFVVLTGIGLGVARHDGGLSSAFASRYYIYSQLLIILLYTGFLQIYLDRFRDSRWAKLSLSAWLACTFLFCALSQVVEFRKLHARMTAINDHYVGWVKAPAAVQLLSDQFVERPFAERDALNAHAVKEFQEARAKGLYSPPVVNSR